VKQTITQFSRYAIVGVASNAVGYLLYLGFTSLGLGPKVAMTMLYVVGVLQTFVFNKKWSFRFDGAVAPAIVRYALVYAAGYVINMLVITLLVDQANLPHQWVMAGLVVFMALFFFAGQKFWVFRQPSKREL
jgi:putative flippase GtrA